MSSKLSEEEKKRILQEKIDSKKTVVQICADYDISIPKYYEWKNRFEAEKENKDKISPPKAKQPKLDKYDTLKKLYIGLSEQNYELAKFLDR